MVDFGQLEEALREPARAIIQAIDEGETVELLRDLIRVNTVHPPGDVREAILRCQSMLAAAGFATKSRHR